MFSAIFLLLFSAVSASNNKNVNATENLTVLGFASNDDSLTARFLRDMQVNDRLITDSNPLFYSFLWNKISYLPKKIIQEEPLAVSKLLNNLFPIPDEFADKMLSPDRKVVYGTFQYIISNLPLIKYEDDNWILRKWNPFRDNIAGLSVYADEKGYGIEEIYINQTEDDINMNNLKLAAFIPGEFLKKLREGKSNEELQNITVGLMVILNGTKFASLWHEKQDIKHLIGVNIAGYCKNDRVSVLKAYFKYGPNDTGNWLEYGSRYVDYPPEFIKELCFLSQMNFFGQINQNTYYDSMTETHCVNSDSGILTHNMHTFGRQNITYGIPNTFCLNNSLIPQETCPGGQITYDNEHKPPCQGELTYPNRTKLFYEMFKLCASMRFGMFCNDSVNYMIEHVTTHLDITIALSLLKMLSYADASEVNRIHKLRLSLAEKELTLLETDRSKQITRLTSLLVNVNIANIFDLYKSPHMTYLALNMFTDVVGFISYKSNTSSIGYDIKILTRKNATLNYSSDPNVNVIAYISTAQENIFDFCRVLAFYGSYVEYTNHTLRSDIVGAYCIFDKFPLNVYLSTKAKRRLKEYYLNEGYSSIVDVEGSTQTTLYIFELKDTVCDPVSKLAIFEKYIPNTDLNSVHLGNLTFRNIDLLSHIASSVNDYTEKVIEEQSTTLKALTFTLSSLSLFGVSSILLSALFLKKWHQPRPYSIQLTVSVTGETIFFLISEQYITQFGYIIFYHFLLTQFIWMLIIAYLQYIRYVKIFESFELNVFKTSLFGWLSPIVITSISILSHLECLQCNFCSKNRDILMHFFIIPISIIVISNTAIYVYVMVMIARSDTDMFEPDARKARRWVTLFLPSILGISWIVFGMLFIPNLGISVIGLYIFHVIASSQGLMIFIFVVLLDKNTLVEWYQKCICWKKTNNAITPTEFALRAR